MAKKTPIRGSIQNFASECAMFVRIGAYKFPVTAASVYKKKKELVLECDFTQSGLGKSFDASAWIQPDGTAIQEQHEGIWLSDLLHLVDRSPNCAPFLTLCIRDVEASASRVISVTRDDNEAEDGPGGYLWLHVDEKILTPTKG